MSKTQIFLSIIILIIHFLVIRLLEISFFLNEIVMIHFFLFFLAIGTEIFKQVTKTKKEVIGLLFFLNFTRMGLCVLFLFWRAQTNINLTSLVVNFFAVYFYYIISGLLFSKNQKIDERKKRISLDRIK